MIDYKGLKHFPLGKAKLELNNDNLILTTDNETGDGFSVDIAERSNWELSFESIELMGGQSINTTLLGLDGSKRIKTIGQTSVFVDENGRGKFAVNSKLMGKTIKMTAIKGGVVVHEEEYANPSWCPNDPTNTSENWIWIAVAVAVVILDHVDYSEIVERDGDGKIIKTTTKKSFGTGGIACQGRTGEEFIADYIYVESSFNYEPHLKPIFENKPSQIQLMCSNVDKMIITNEKYL